MFANNQVGLLVADMMGSVVGVAGCTSNTIYSYHAYGWALGLDSGRGGLGFNGEYKELHIPQYALGNGHRLYSPVVCRFNRPDQLSPFSVGGINAYAYCLGDPINRYDSTGRKSLQRIVSGFFTKAKTKIFRRRYGRMAESNIAAASPLRNNSPRNYQKDYADVVSEVKKQNVVVTVVSARTDFKILSDDSLQHKFVLTGRGELIVGSIGQNGYITHAGLALYGKNQHGLTDDIVFGGYLRKLKGAVTVDNHTGHYHAPYDRLALAKYKIRGMGVPAKTNRSTVRLEWAAPLRL